MGLLKDINHVIYARPTSFSRKCLLEEEKGYKRIFHKTYSSNGVFEETVSDGCSVILPDVCVSWCLRMCTCVRAFVCLRGIPAVSTFTVVASVRVRSFAV